MCKYLAVLLIVGLGTACGTRENSDPIRQFIPGKYVRKVENQFSTGNDTLFISVLSPKGNSYIVKKIGSLKKIRNEKRIVAEVRSETWTAVYNESEKVLHETVKGKVLSFYPEKNVLFVGASEYKKIGNDVQK